MAAFLKTRALMPLAAILVIIGAESATLGGRGAVLDEFARRRTPALERAAARIAKEALRAHLEGKPAPKIRAGHPLLLRRAGVFVTLKKGDRVRGCMGSVYPRERTIAEEIALSAVDAAASDPRYRPVSRDELKDLVYSISIVGPLRRAKDLSELQPKRYGLLVRAGERGGVLLPGEAKTARWQMEECRRKAGIPPKSPVEMFLFETVVLESRG